MPAFVPPQLPSLASKPPTGERWIHEIKHDGYRTQILVDSGRARALTRNGHDWSAGYSRLVAAALELDCRSAIIDGEAIVQDESGVADFHALAGALRYEPHRICMIAFDLLHLDGRDLRNAPLDERLGLLRGLLSDRDPAFALHYSEEFEGSSSDLFAAVERHGLEGIVSKRRNSRYRTGKCDTWLKVKCFAEDTFEVVGFERTQTGEVNALLARPVDAIGHLEYAGKAFVTLGREDRERFWREASRLGAERPPAGVRTIVRAQWLQPGLKVRARFLRGEKTLRHASLLGVITP
jgi:bifunctional non-homologous end joining protein LigD